MKGNKSSTKLKYLVGTLCAGLMEEPEYYFHPPYMIIEAKSKSEAVNIYNGKSHAKYFYGSVIANIDNNKLENISTHITKEEANRIYNEIVSISAPSPQ